MVQRAHPGGGRQTRCGPAAAAPDVLSAPHCQRQQSTHTKPAGLVFKFGMRRVCRSCMTLLLLASRLRLLLGATKLSSCSTFSGFFFSEKKTSVSRRHNAPIKCRSFWEIYKGAQHQPRQEVADGRNGHGENRWKK